MSHELVGHITHYYEHLRVAVLTLTAPIQLGEWLHIAGHTTDFVQPVISLQIDHQPVSEAEPGQDVAVKVANRVRAHDAVYRITSTEAREFECAPSLDPAW
jgi:putative protease